MPDDPKYNFPVLKPELEIIRDHHRRLADQLAASGYHVAATKLRERAEAIDLALVVSGWSGEAPDAV